jgi:dihydrofolate reductase / thymidylate synthase
MSISETMEISVIVGCCSKNRGIGKNNTIPWKLKGDLQHFKKNTINEHGNYPQNTVIMGRNTWESLPKSMRPLPKRINIVVSNSGKMDTDVQDKKCCVATSLNDAIYLARSFNSPYAVIIGGERLYKEAILSPMVSKLNVTEIYEEFECDTFFPTKKELEKHDFIMTDISNFNNENGIYYRFLEYWKKDKINRGRCEWKNDTEITALKSMELIMEFGQERIERTGIGTRSLFGLQWKYNLRYTFPIWTTKRIFFKGIFAELQLYLSGKTDNHILQEQGIHIWDGNTTRDFLDKRGLTHYKEGDMGETYGFNMRHYGAEYKGCDKNYTGTGFDQLEYVLNLIKNEPSSRRMLMTLWNPGTSDNAALPACMLQYQFYVNEETKELLLQVYLRSSDYFLANNWNVITGALLVHLICNLKDIDLTPGELTVVTGDTHIYLSHIKAVEENLKRTPRPFPYLHVNEKKDKLTDFTYEDLKLIDYCPYPGIKVDMAV